jgi:TonB family protein
MYVKSLSFLAILSLFAVLTISAIPAQTQTSATASPAAAGDDLNAKAHAIFDKGVQLNGLTAKDMQPYHLKGTYEIYEGDPTPEAGTLEVWSTGPDQWKRTYSGKKYSGTEWSVTATERYQAKGEPKENFDHAKLDLRVGVPTINPLYQSVNFKPEYEFNGGLMSTPVAMTCIMVAPSQNPGNLIPTYCFDADSHARLVNVTDTAFQLDDFQIFQNRAIAKNVKVIVNHHLTSEVKVTLLEPLSPADAAVVKPGGNAIPQPWTRLPGDPKLVVVKQAGAMYPMKAAEQRALGTVYVNAIILKSGKVKIKGATGNPYLTQAASDAIQDWKFQPYKIDGQVVDVEAMIPYTFDGKPFIPWPGGVEPNPAPVAKQ